MQDLKSSNKSTVVKGNTDSLYEARFKPKDLLSITVVTSEPNASRSYNLLVPQLSQEFNNSVYSTPTMQTYLVGNDGYINFPVLGRILVAGLTRKELESKIQKQLDPAFSSEHPIITIRITNYTVTVLGEVSVPRKLLVINDRITIFESLAMADDMTVYGKRNDVKVLRENIDGSKTIIKLNLNDVNIIHSNAYYLEQNDVVYVEPNKARSRSANIGTAETLSVSAISIVISLASLVVNILR